MEPTKLSEVPASKTLPAKLTPEAIKVIMAAMAMTARGLKGRRLRNAAQRVKGHEPEPGLYAGVQRRARYLSRVPNEIAVAPHIPPRHKRAA
jgi:hypothetical protein